MHPLHSSTFCGSPMPLHEPTDKPRSVAPRWIALSAAAFTFVLSIPAAVAAVVFYRRGGPGDGAAATTLIACILLVSSVFFYRVADHRNKALARSSSRCLTFAAIPVALLWLWAAGCFAWDTLEILNHDYLHFGEFGTYTKVEGSSAFEVMISSFAASVVCGLVGVFLVLFAAGRLLHCSSDTAVLTDDSQNPYSPPPTAGEQND